MKLNRRPATDDDYDFVRDASHEAYRTVVVRQFGEWRDEWQERYFHEKWQRATYEIVELDGEAVGALRIIVEDDHHRLDEIVLRERFQRQGIGTQLIEAELERAHAAGLPLRLQVLHENVAARRLYERLGFVAYDEIETHVLMEARRA